MSTGREAVIRMLGATPQFDAECMRLTFGMSEWEAYRYETAPGLWDLPKWVVRRGHLRRVAFQKRTRTVSVRRPPVVSLLMHYAEREGVRLVYVDADGQPTVLVEGGEALAT